MFKRFHILLPVVVLALLPACADSLREAGYDTAIAPELESADWLAFAPAEAFSGADSDAIRAEVAGMNRVLARASWLKRQAAALRNSTSDP